MYHTLSDDEEFDEIGSSNSFSDELSSDELSEISADEKGRPATDEYEHLSEEHVDSYPHSIDSDSMTTGMLSSTTSSWEDATQDSSDSDQQMEEDGRKKIAKTHLVMDAFRDMAANQQKKSFLDMINDVFLITAKLKPLGLCAKLKDKKTFEGLEGRLIEILNSHGLPTLMLRYFEAYKLAPECLQNETLLRQIEGKVITGMSDELMNRLVQETMDYMDISTL